MAQTEAQGAIRVVPLSPGVGLWVDGVDLHRLTPAIRDMIEDLWQLGGALLFREQDQPEAAAAALASVLGKVPVSLEGAGEIGSLAILRTLRTFSSGISRRCASSSGVGSRPISWSICREVRTSLLIVSIICTGIRMVRA